MGLSPYPRIRAGSGGVDRVWAVTTVSAGATVPNLIGVMMGRAGAEPQLASTDLWA